MSQVSYGTITIVDTNDIESITIEYAQNQDSSNPPSSGWDTVRPTWRQNYFIWQRTRIHKSGTTADKDSFGAAVCLTGSTGATGSTGQSLSTTKTQYTHVASNVTITTSNHTSYTWTDNVPEYDSTKPVYWGRITNTYMNPAKTEYIIYKDNGLTEAIANSVEANTNASDALDKANESNSIAIHANENAQGALSISRATQQHFWFNSTTSGSIEAGAYITDTPIDTFKSGKNGGYLLARSDGLELGRGTNKFMTLSATALNFYRPGTNTIDATLTSKGLILTKGGLKVGTYNASAADVNQNFVYLSSEDYGTAIKIGDSSSDKKDWRQIIGNKFGVDRAGNLYASGANIQGKVTVTSGSNVYTTDDVNPLNVGGRNLIISFASIVGSVLNSSGELVDNPRGVVSDFIDVEPNTKYILQYWLPEELTDTGNDRAWNCNICWYNQVATTSSATITYVSGYTAEYFDDYVFYAVESPSDAKLCRVCFELPASYQGGVVSENWTNGDDGYKWKLEQGTIATDWTLAPEDTNNIASQQDWYLLTDNGSSYENVSYNYVTKQSGDIISIDDAVSKYPTESLIVDIEPIQDLNGYDSPWVGGAGKNKIYVTADNSASEQRITITGTEGNITMTSTSNYGRAGYSASVVSGQTYTFSVDITKTATSGTISLLYLNNSVSWDTHYRQINISKDVSAEQHLSVTFTADSDTFFVGFYVTAGTGSGDTLVIKNAQLELGSIATAYEPYSNICPISGRTEVVTQRTGVNVWDEEWEVGSISNTTGNNASNAQAIRSKNYIPVIGGATYFFRCDASMNKYNIQSRFYDADKNYLGTGGTWYCNRAFTIPTNARYMRFGMQNKYGTTYKNDISINYPSTDHDYHAYNGQTYTTALGRTVYGGTLDVVSGELVVDRAMVDLGTISWIKLTNAKKTYFQSAVEIADMKKSTGNLVIQPITCSHYQTETWSRVLDASGYNGCICEGWKDKSNIAIYDEAYVEVSATDFQTAMSGVQLCYELAQPQTIQLTPQQIDLLLGTNHLWSDGDITIKYIATKSAEWSTVYQLPDQYNPYVWWKYVQTYSSGQVYESIPVIFNSNPQSQLDGLDLQITNQNTIIDSLNTGVQEVNQKYDSIESNQQNIVRELERYSKGVLVDPEIPMVKVFTETEYVSHNQTIYEESSVNVYSDIVEIKGNGNTVTEIDSESLKSETIYSTTLLPRVKEIVQDYHPTKDREVDTTKTYYTKEEDVYTEVESPTSTSLDEYYEYGDVTKLYGKLAFIARKNGHFSIKVISNDERG